MKSCVLTANFDCDVYKVWMYLTNPTLAHWRTDVTETEISPDGMQRTDTHKDGSKTQIVYSRKEKPRAITCEFAHGRQTGTFTAILLGGQGSTSLECTFSIDGIGLFDKAHKHLQPVLDMLQRAVE